MLLTSKASLPKVRVCVRGKRHPQLLPIHFCAGGLNDRIRRLQLLCRDSGALLVYALSRRKLARALGIPGTASVVGLMMLDGVFEQLKVCPVLVCARVYSSPRTPCRSLPRWCMLPERSSNC